MSVRVAVRVAAMSAYLLLADQLDSQAIVADEQARTLRAQAAAIRETAQRQQGRGPVEVASRTLSIRDAADRMSASKGFVRALIAKGDLKVTRLSGRVVRVAEADVAALIRRRTA